MSIGLKVVKGQRVRPVLHCGESMTKQSFAAECDINTILRNFVRGDAITHLNGGVATYADVSKIGDYYSAMQTVAKASEMFNALPSEIRNRFHNDPGELLDFVQDSKNLDEAVKLGIVDKLPEAAVLEPTATVPGSK